MLRLFVTLSLVVAIAADDCRTYPLQWEADVALTMSLNDKTGKGHYHVSLDASKRKVALIAADGDMIFDGQPLIQTHLYDYDNGVYYLVDNGTGCAKGPLHDDPFTIPANSKVSEGYQGLLEKNSMNITTHLVYYAGPFYQGSAYVSLTQDCIVTRQFFVGDGWMGVFDYYNVTLGIADPTVLNIPLQCVATDGEVTVEKEKDSKKYKKYKTYKKKFSESDMDKMKASLYSKSKADKNRILPAELQPDATRYNAKVGADDKQKKYFSGSDTEKKKMKMKFSGSHKKKKDE